MAVTSSSRTPGQRDRSIIGFELCGNSPMQDGTDRWGAIIEIVQIGRKHYFLIDSGHWTHGNRRLIPIWAVSSIDLVNRECTTELEAEVVRRAPNFDPFHLADSRYHHVLENVFGDAS